MVSDILLFIFFRRCLIICGGVKISARYQGWTSLGHSLNGVAGAANDHQKRQGCKFPLLVFSNCEREIFMMTMMFNVIMMIDDDGNDDDYNEHWVNDHQKRQGCKFPLLVFSNCEREILMMTTMRMMMINVIMMINDDGNDDDYNEHCSLSIE